MDWLGTSDEKSTTIARYHSKCVPCVDVIISVTAEMRHVKMKVSRVERSLSGVVAIASPPPSDAFS